MLTINKKIITLALGFALLCAAVPASAQSYYRDRDRMSTQKKALVIGGSAAAGAVIGGLLGGKKGALIGGLLGGGAGTGYVVLNGRRNNDDRYGYYDSYGRYHYYDRVYDRDYGRYRYSDSYRWRR